MISTALHERLHAAVGDRTYRHLSELTQTHPETVRRYMQGQAPAVEFLTSLCDALGISGDWLLTGRGPMRSEEQRAQTLREAGPGDLLAAMASNIERLVERVDRLERYVQTLEVRVRAGERPGQTRPVQVQGPVHEQGQSPGSTNGTFAGGGQSAAGAAPERVQRVRSVLAQRPRADAR